MRIGFVYLNLGATTDSYAIKTYWQLILFGAAVFDGETLNADVPSDSGMRHVRVSISVSLSLVAHTHVILCVSQEKSRESSQILP